MTSFNDVLQILPKLTSTERNKIASAIKALDQFNISNVDKSAKTNSDLELFLSILSQFLSDKGLEYSSPNMLKRNRAYKSFANKIEHMQEWIDGLSMSKVQKGSFFMIGIELLHNYIVRDKKVIGATLLMLNIHKLPQVVDAQFPGYYRLGLLNMVIKKGS